MPQVNSSEINEVCRCIITYKIIKNVKYRCDNKLDIMSI